MVLLCMVQKAIMALMGMLMGLSGRLGSGFLGMLEKFDKGIATRTQFKARGMKGERGQLGLGTILAAFVVVIATFVVLIVVDEFDQSVGSPSSSQLSAAQGDILSGFSSMVSLVEPLLLIAIGVVIIGLIRRVQ